MRVDEIICDRDELVRFEYVLKVYSLSQLKLSIENIPFIV